MSNAVAGGDVQLMGVDSALEMGLAMPGDPTEHCLFPKTANTLVRTGFIALNGFQDSIPGKDSDDFFGVFEPRPVVPFSKRPPKAVEDIYKSLPSVASFFPDWPFYPLELLQSIPKRLKRKDAEKLKSQQDWNRELSLTRVHAPGTAAHRLLNHSFKQDVKDFSTEFETFRMNDFRTLPGEQQKAKERPMPYIFGVSRYNPQLHNPEFCTSNQGMAVKSADEVADLHNKVFKCSLCKFSPRHDDIPNWLYYTKVDENSPRYFYCLSCKGRDGDARVKSFTNLMTIVKEIAAISHAEVDAKKMGMGGVITSVPLARFKRYEIMFSIEVEAAMVRRAIKAAKTQLGKNAEEFRQQQPEEISGDLGFSIVGKAVAKEIVDRYFTTEVPRLFDTPGPLGQPERFGSTTPPGFLVGIEPRDQRARVLAVSDEEEAHFQVERSHTPPGWPRGYIPAVIADNVHQGDDSQTSLGRPPTPVWFAERQKRPTTPPPPVRSTTPPVYRQWFAPSPEREYEESILYTGATKLADTLTCRSTTPPGYPEWFIPQSSAPCEELTDAPRLTNASTARSSIIQPEVHAPFRNFSAFIHPDDAMSGDHNPGYPEGAIAWLTRADTPPSSARSSRTLYEDYIPQFDGACDTPGSSARSSITLPEDFGPRLADTIAIVEHSSPRLFEIFRNKPLVDATHGSKKDSLPDPGHPLRRSPAVEDSLYLLSQGGIPARLPLKTERIPPAKAKPLLRTEHIDPVRSEGTPFYNYTPEEENKKDPLDPGQPPPPSPTGDSSLYLLSQGGIPAKLPPKTERIPPARSERASYYKNKSGENFPQNAEGTVFYRPSIGAQPVGQIGRAPFPNNSSTINEADPPSKPGRATFYKYNFNATIPQKTERRSFYKCRNHTKDSTSRSSSHDSLSSIAEERLEEHPESDFSDISADWDSDESFDELPRRLRCLDLLDELIPPRQEEYVGCSLKMWNSRPMGKRGRNVDLSLNSIFEDSEPEEGELGDCEQELVQRGKMKDKRSKGRV